MYFPKFWARASEPARGTAGRSLRVSCWRWSDQSLADAQEMARQAARQLADRFARGMIAKARYGYGDRPFREPVIRDMRDESNELTAVLSRNSYGCLVLNTSRVMFVDVDIPQLESAAPGWLRKLTRKPAPESLVEQALGRAEQWCRRTPGLGGAGVSDAGRAAVARNPWFVRARIRIHPVRFRRGECGSAVSQTVPDAEMFPGAGYAQTVAV